MPPRKEKIKIDKVHKEGALNSEDDAGTEENVDAYNCVGDLVKDFTALCTKAGLTLPPAIRLRPKAPGSPVEKQHSAHDQKPERGSKSKKEKIKEAQIVDHEATDNDNDGEPIEQPPKTYITKDKFEYFKPSIQVDLEAPDKYDSVSDVYIHGWKIDLVMANILAQSFPSLEKLTHISFWNVAFNLESITAFAKGLPLCTALKNLELDGTTMSDEGHYKLISDDFFIQHLSLRYNSISDEGAKNIAYALGHGRHSNTKLLTLNLAGNRITDIGATYLSQALRVNRTLVSLSLGGNLIGDIGAKKFAESLSRFSLSYEEIIERRKLLTEKSLPDRTKSPPASRRSDRHRPLSTMSDGKKKEKKKTGSDKDSDKTIGKSKGKRESDTKSKKQSTDTKEKSKSMKGSISKRNPKPVQAPPTPEPNEMQSVLLDQAEPIDGELWMKGNTVLINLNLANNKIGTIGVESLLKALQYQQTYSHFTKPKSKSSNTPLGLIRLNLAANSMIPSGFNALQKINEYIASKDPLARSPSRSENNTRENSPTKT